MPKFYLVFMTSMFNNSFNKLRTWFLQLTLPADLVSRSRPRTDVLPTRTSALPSLSSQYQA